MNVKLISLVSILVMFSGLSAAMIGFASDGAEPTIVTDGTGRSFEYTEPTEHIVTMGYGSTLTVAALGEIDKIIAVDAYSTYSYTKDERLKDLDAEDLGSYFNSANNDYIVTLFLQWTESGEMNYNDTIILTSYSNTLVLREKLESAGFTHVLVYLSITAYDQIVDFVESVSIIVTGGVSTIVEDMRLVKSTIDERLEGVTDKAKGLGVWYTSSTGEFSVGNRGSITVSLIETAGGINAAYDPSKSSTTYGNASNIVQLVEADPDVVVFLPANYMRDNTLSDFRNNILGGDDSVTIVPLHAYWNNYDPYAAEGLWAFACAMYPDLFEGLAPHVDEPSDSNPLMYAAVGAVFVTAILSIAYFMVMRP